MPRPLRFIPEHSLVEITTRTLQGRLLLKPSPELTDIILGIIGKAQALYGMTIHAFVFLSTKEGLSASSASWPGPNCIAALTTGAILRGTWFDRSKEFLARQRGEHTLPMQFATTFDLRLTPLPGLLDMTEDQRQAHYRRVVGEIQAKAEADDKEKGRTPMTAFAILAQDPHSKPATTDPSPAPFVRATDDSTEQEFRVAYRAFVDPFRAGALRLRERQREIRDMFPLWAFPPQLPFNETA